MYNVSNSVNDVVQDEKNEIITTNVWLLQVDNFTNRTPVKILLYNRVLFLSTEVILRMSSPHLRSTAVIDR